MANVNMPMGLQPVKYLNGSPWNGQATRYCIPSGDTTAYYLYDPVTTAGSADANGVATVSIGVAGAAILGSIVGVEVAGDNLDIKYVPATKTRDYYVYVADDPNLIFEIQESGTAMAAADVGLNANFVIAAPSSTVSPSATAIGNSTKNTTATLNLKLLGLSQRVDNAFGTYAKWLVLINNHQYKAGTGTAGV